MKTARKYYPGITVFKVIGAILVLFGHVQLPLFYQHLTAGVAGISTAAAIVVPCFYIVSGFLVYNSWQHAKNPAAYVKKHLSWLAIVYCTFCSFNILGSLLPVLLQHPVTAHALLTFVKRAGIIIFLRGYPHMFYFIPPLILGTLVVFNLIRCNKTRLAVAIAIAGYLFAQTLEGSFAAFGLDLSHSISSKAVKTFIIYNFGIGYPYILAGAFTARHIKSFLSVGVVTFAIGSSVIVCLELVALNLFVNSAYTYRIGFSALPLSLFLFYGLLKVKTPWIKQYHRPLNTFSIVIYFSHFFLIQLNTAILGAQRQALIPLQILACILLTLAECVIITWAVLKFIKKEQHIPLPQPQRQINK